MGDLLPLNLLSPGQTGQVQHVSGCADAVGRLAELGMHAGTQLEIVRNGSPCIVRLGDSRFCFRQSDAVNVFVQLDVAV